MLLLALNLLPTEHDQSLMFMQDVRGWEPTIADMQRMDYLGMKYKKPYKSVENVIAVK